MKTFQKREDPILLMKRRIVIVILVILVLVLGRGVYGVIVKEEESRLLRVEVERELAELKGRENEIRTNIAELASERGVERALRSEYELAKEGESVIVIVGDEQEEESPSVQTTFQPWWHFWR